MPMEMTFTSWATGEGSCRRPASAGWVTPSIRGIEAVDVGVEHADPVALDRQCGGEVYHDRGLAHPPLPDAIA